MTEEAKTFTRTIKFLDLESFTIRTKPVSFSFAEPSTYEEAVSRVEPTLHADGTIRSSVDQKLRSAVSSLLKSEAAADAMASAGVSDNLKTVNKILRPFRAMEPFKSMESADREKALMDFLRSNEGLVEAIRANAAEDDDENDENETAD